MKKVLFLLVFVASVLATYAKVEFQSLDNEGIIDIQNSAQNAGSQSDSIRNWTAQWQKQLLEDRENPAKWDAIHYKEDLQEFSNQNQQPISVGVFPVPNYDLYPGTFDGIIAANFDLHHPSGQRIACVVNGNSKTSLNESFLGENDEDFYFILLEVV